MPTLPPNITAPGYAPEQLLNLFRRYLAGQSILKEGPPDEGPTMEEILSNNVGAAPSTKILMGDPGSAPGMAMVPNVNNLGQFRKLINKHINDLPKAWPEEMKQAVAYLQARYPSLSKRVTIGANKNLEPGFIGQYAHARDLIGNPVVGNRAKKAVGSLEVNPESAKSLEDMLNVLGHEMTHNILDIRMPYENYYDYFYPIRSGKLVNDIKDYYRYFTQPAEKLARRGGKTVTKSFDKFLNLTGF